MDGSETVQRISGCPVATKRVGPSAPPNDRYPQQWQHSVVYEPLEVYISAAAICGKFYVVNGPDRTGRDLGGGCLFQA